MDAVIHRGLRAAGVADSARYTGPEGGPVVDDVRVYVDRDVMPIGETGQALAPRTEIGIVLKPGLQPLQNGRVEVDGDVFLLGKRIGGDSSLSRWVVRRG
ncbi:hypothetical protein CO641_02410 [Lysobacteraceae bacterium NML91-0213]|nr:hypothetical protein CO641_02410 [Xanthomonadaceae bacterium NML91-0213]